MNFSRTILRNFVHKIGIDLQFLRYIFYTWTQELKVQGIEWVIDGAIDVTKTIVQVEVERKTEPGAKLSVND